MFLSWVIFAGACNTAFHSLTKLLPKFKHPFASLTVSYLVAAAVSFLCCIFVDGPQNVSAAFQCINGYSIVIGFALVGVETGLFYLYRADSPLSTTHLLVSIAETAVNVAVGIALFREELNLTNILGLAIGILGTFLVTCQPSKKQKAEKDQAA